MSDQRPPKPPESHAEQVQVGTQPPSSSDPPPHTHPTPNTHVARLFQQRKFCLGILEELMGDRPGKDDPQP